MQARMSELQSRYTAVRTTDRVEARLIREEVSVLQADIERLEERIDSLTVTAPLDGVYMQLPLGEMTGRHVDRGDLLGYVAPAEMASARVVVTQDDLDRIIHAFEANYTNIYPSGARYPEAGYQITEIYVEAAAEKPKPACRSGLAGWRPAGCGYFCTGRSR